MINVLDRITYFRKQKNWTEYQLAEQSGLTQSTISSWYRKDMLPTISSLEKICVALNISLSEFFATEADVFSLTAFQKELLDEAHHLTTEQQLALINFLKSL